MRIGRGICRASFQLDSSAVYPVEAEVGFGEVETLAARGVNQPSGCSDKAADERAQPVLAGLLGQKVELHRAHKHLGNLPAGMKGFVGQQLATWQVVQVSQRTHGCEVQQREIHQRGSNSEMGSCFQLS